MALLMILSAFILIALPVLWFGLGISLSRGKRKRFGWLSLLFALMQVLALFPSIPFFGSWFGPGSILKDHLDYYLTFNLFLFASISLTVFFTNMAEKESDQ